jgi:hypothetical protein
MQFTDAVTVSGTRRTAEGYLIADANAVRSGIQLYAGSEVGKPELPVVRVYRAEDQVRDVNSLRSFSHAPVTLDHPTELVTADNWKALAVGEVSTEAAWDGSRIRLPLILKDGAAIKEVEAGKRELSAGYTCDLVWEAGKTPSGEAYDARQTNIRANHVAIVDRGRAGSECRIGDADRHVWGPAPITPTPEKETRAMSDALRTVVVDGLSVTTTDQGAQAITKLMKDLESSAAKLVDAEKAHHAKLADVDKAHADAIKLKDTELAKKDAEIDGLKAKVLSDADLDKRVAARAELIGKAKAVAKDVKTDGLSDAAIRKAAVTAVLGDVDMAGKTDAYIDARFDILVEDAAKAKPDAFRQAVQQGVQPVVDGSAATTAHKAMTDHLQSAWQNSKGAA